MARGWESKSVEEQIQTRESEAPHTSAPKRTPEQRRQQVKREGILLARTRTLTALQSACDGRYRAHLERVLADLDAQLAAVHDSA